MRDKEPIFIEPLHSETPDIIIPVEDYGAKIVVEVWHSTTPPKLRTTFTCERISNDNMTSDNQITNETMPWIRQEEYYILRRKAYLAGLGAISLHRATQNNHELDRAPIIKQ